MNRPKHSFPATGNHIPEDKDQRLVQTPYGKGMVIRSKRQDGVREIELVDWENSKKTAKGRPTTLYSATDLPSVPPQVGDDVLTIYGRGRVLAVGEQVTVLLSSWRLAGRSRVTCYLQHSACQVVRQRKLYEMSVFEKVEAAQKFKQEATVLFKAKQFAEALRSYALAIDAVRYVQHKPSSTNEVRADLLVIMITCSNNAGTCCTQLQNWAEVQKFAKNSLVLIEALEAKKGKKIHQILNQDGYADSKLFGEWKVKSCLLLARAMVELQDFDQAVTMLKTAHEIIGTYTSNGVSTAASKKQLLANDKEVKKLHGQCKERRKTLLKKEKLRAQAMFASKDEEKKEATTAVESNNPIAPEPKSFPATTSSKPRAPPALSSQDRANRPKPKKQVSFAEDTKPAAGVGEDEVEWYSDPEVLTGLAIFGGTVVATIAGLSYLLGKKR